MSNIPISASWLNDHDYCEYKFYRKHVLKEEIPRTSAMVVGSKVHEQKEEKFLEIATQSTMDEFLDSKKYTITKELYLEHIFDDFVLKGKIDEIGIDENNVYIIDDKPNAKPYEGTLRQIWAYCTLFKKNYPGVNKTLLGVLRDRDTNIEVWKKPFLSKDSFDVHRALLRIKLLFKGYATPLPNTVPQKCGACILHKLNRCEYSLG